VSIIGANLDPENQVGDCTIININNNFGLCEGYCIDDDNVTRIITFVVEGRYGIDKGYDIDK
jgi:hypothetical protein